MSCCIATLSFQFLLCMFFHCSAAGNMVLIVFESYSPSKTIQLVSIRHILPLRTGGNVKKSLPFSRSFQLKFSKGLEVPFHWRGTQLKSFKPPSRNSKKPLLVLSFATNLADSPSAEPIEAEKKLTQSGIDRNTRLDCCDKK